MASNTRNPLKRRQFLGLITGAIASLIAAAYALPAVAYILGGSLREKTESWISLGSVTKVPIDTPTLFKTRLARTSGWITTEEDLSVYVLTQDGRDFIAMSNICTHLGCRVRWIEEREQFYCPCHNGVFDREGNVVSGPPPRPLDRYQVKVEQDQISILGN
jgi:menaquinol-cytochrome c reductase iron-sulfur subunit